MDNHGHCVYFRKKYLNTWWVDKLNLVSTVRLILKTTTLPKKTHYQSPKDQERSNPPSTNRIPSERGYNNSTLYVILLLLLLLLLDLLKNSFSY